MKTAIRAFAAFLSASFSFSSTGRAADPAPRLDEASDERASPMVVSFDWRRGAGAESCIDSETLARDVEWRLQRRVFGALQADVFLRGQIERNESEFHARLTMVAANGQVLGERELSTDASDCGRLDESLALVVALAIDSLRSIPAASLRVPKTTPREKVSWRLGPYVVVSSGLFPGLGGGIGMDGSMRPPSFWPIELAWAVSPVSPSATAEGHGARFLAVQTGLFLCPATIGSRVELRGCFGFEADYLRASGFSLDHEFSPSTIVAGPAARLATFFPAGSTLLLSPSFSASIPLWRDRFTYTAEDQSTQVLHQPSKIVLFFGFGVLARIP